MKRSSFQVHSPLPPSFGSDATPSGNNDKIYIDDIEITGCVEGGRWGDPLVESSFVETESVEIMPFGSAVLYPNPTSESIQLDYELAPRYGG